MCKYNTNGVGGNGSWQQATGKSLVATGHSVMKWSPSYLLRSMSEEDEDEEAGALGLLPPPLLLLPLWHSGVERIGSPASQLSADERDPDRSSEDLQRQQSDD